MNFKLSNIISTINITIKKRMFLKVISFLIVIFAVVVTLFYQAVVLNPIHFRPVDLTGKTVIVTGGSSGIGLETVRKLVEWNASVIMPVRNIQKGELVRKDILSTQVSHTGSIELMILDLTSFDSVRKFASEIIQKNIHIDIVILNAVSILYIFKFYFIF